MASTLGFRIFMDDAAQISQKQREATKQLGDRAYLKKDFSSVMVRPGDDGYGLSIIGFLQTYQCFQILIKNLLLVLDV